MVVSARAAGGKVWNAPNEVDKVRDLLRVCNINLIQRAWLYKYARLIMLAPKHCNPHYAWEEVCYYMTFGCKM